MILDCTLRDGGYYTHWDFDKSLVETYIDSFNQLPIDYLEIGYRSNPLEGYLGEYFYCPIHVMNAIKVRSDKKLVVILNEKDVRAADAESLLGPCLGLITMIRLAIDPKNFSRALELAAAVKTMGFEVGFNVMYMSTWKEHPEFLAQLSKTKGVCDYFYMVDSFGGVYPEDVKEIYSIVKAQVDVPIGFHGHNNLELGLINTLTAIECGADIVDATVTGMGRGAGNLKTELLLTALNAKQGLDVNFNALSAVVDAFQKLEDSYGWGTNLPYMVSGANSLPQKQVMEWVGKRFYSFNSIIRALNNQKDKKQDNEKLPVLNVDKKYRLTLIIGGGPQAVLHIDAIRKFIALKKQDICLIHASSRNAANYLALNVDQYYCLVGSEGHRMEKVFENFENFKGICALPPFPRKMGTYIPEAVKSQSRELKEIEFTSKLTDTHTALALQLAQSLGAEEIYLVGYDGYQEGVVGQKEMELLNENEFLFASFKKYTNHDLRSLTPTRYKELFQDSLFAKLT